jgi:mRNA interferase MazF
VNRGEIWLTEIGRKRRPVLVLTRPEVIDVRELVTVAEVSTTVRNIAAEVEFDHVDAGLDRPSVINCDGLHTITKASLTAYAGVCWRRNARSRLCGRGLRPRVLSDVDPLIDLGTGDRFSHEWTDRLDST